MYPELFELPFTHLTVKSYGLMMVIGFLSAVFVIRRLSRNFTPDPGLITNAALYTLIAGVVGARLFYVVHYFENFRGDFASMFAIWQGGLELLGGVILAIIVIYFYLRHHKLPIRHYLDALAVGLMLALVFGRMGCFLNGCCFGKPTDQLWGVRFPYNSFAYASQVRAQPKRNRDKPQLELPADFFNYSYGSPVLKPYEELSPEQQEMVTYGPYRCLHVHPTQLYSSAAALFCSFLLYLFWRRSQTDTKPKSPKKPLTKPGSTFAMMFILYGIARFFLEFARDDNPFEHAWWAIYKGGTVSQNLGIYMVILGVLFMVVFQRMRDYKPATKSKRR